VDTFHNKVALVTGAASGIGLGLARALVRAGASVAMVDKRQDVLAEAAAEVAREGGRVIFVTLDVTDRDGWVAAANRVEAELGNIDVLCSNAGVNFIGPTHQATFEDWDFALGVNVGGAINAVRTVAPRMIARGTRGHVMITSSVSGLFTGGGSGVYATSKYALVGLSESLRADLRPHGIGVSVLCPGPVKSELFESTATVRPERLAASGSLPLLPPGVAREETPIFVTAPDGDEIARQALEGIRRNRLYILTHAEIRPVLEARSAALLASLPAGSVNPARIEASSRLLDVSLYANANS
jgi:NAD(P)-dependent dehydrogenase (short-subunit alcohol dehydrogenase family)